MAATNLIPIEVYLRASYRPDMDYVDGVIEERNSGQNDHSAWQKAFVPWFQLQALSGGIRVRPELRVQVKPARFLIPDVSILNAANPKEPFATKPPVAAFEVWSPENTLREMMRKFDDYEQMGIPQIWFIDPKDAIWQRCSDGRLADSDRFSEPSMGIEFEMSEIAKLLQ